MRNLLIKELEKVSGGRYEITIVAKVPDNMSDWVQSIITQVNSGALANPYDFRTQLNAAVAQGIDLTAPNIQLVSYKTLPN